MKTQNIEVDKITKLPSGIIVLSYRGITQQSFAEAKDLTMHQGKIWLLLDPDRVLSFQVHLISDVGTASFEVIPSSSNFNPQVYNQKLLNVFETLTKDLLDGCAGTYNKLLYPANTTLQPTKIELISTNMVGFFRNNSLLFAIKRKMDVQLENNKTQMRIDRNILVNFTDITEIGSTLTSPALTSPIQVSEINKKANECYNLLINNVFTSPCDSTPGGTTVGIDLKVLSITSAAARFDNWAPAGWPDATDLVKVIRLNATNSNNVVMLSGLVSGASGRIVTIVNDTLNTLMILEHQSPSSSIGNQLFFDQQSAFFLMPQRQITLLHNGIHWYQFTNTNNFGGFDFVDDLSQSSQNGATGAVSTALSTNLFNYVTSGTGASVNSAAEIKVFGATRLRTGTTTTGFVRMAMDNRNTSGAFWDSGGTNVFPLVIVGKLAIENLANVANDFRAVFGHNYGVVAQYTSDPFPGYFWVAPTAASGLTTWQNVTTNTTIAITVSVDSGIPLSTNWIYLGIFVIGNRGDAVYFYSNDNVTWNVSSKFTWVSGAYGGRPYFGIMKTAGTTDRTLNIDWFGTSFNLKR